MLGLSKPSENKAATTTGGTASTTPTQRQRRTVAPRCDIRETADSVIVLADMPGVAADAVDVRLHGDLLTLSGRSSVNEPDSFTALWREYATRDYERGFRLGQAVDPEHIAASIKDGVLRVELKKRAAATPKKITVQGG